MSPGAAAREAEASETEIGPAIETSTTILL